MRLFNWLLLALLCAGMANAAVFWEAFATNTGAAGGHYLGSPSWINGTSATTITVNASRCVIGGVIYINNKTGAPPNLNLSVEADGGGVPSNNLANTTAIVTGVASPSAGSWYSLNFTSPVFVPAGGAWLVWKTATVAGAGNYYTIVYDGLAGKTWAWTTGGAWMTDAGYAEVGGVYWGDGADCGGGAPVASSNFTRVSQSPSDLTSLNLFGGNFSVLYNVTQYAENVGLWWKTNSSSNLIWVNGSANPAAWSAGVCNQVANYTDLSSWNCSVSANVYPGSFNLLYSQFDAAHTNLVLGNSSAYAKVRFLNVSSGNAYGFFEFNASGSGSGALKAYYCNSSYTTSNPANSSYCALMGVVPVGTAFNYTRSAYSSYLRLPFGVNTTTGAFNGVQVTPESYLLLRGASGASWSVGYVSTVTREDQAQFSYSAGASWSNLSGTLDAHLYQINATDKLNYHLEATINGSAQNSSILTDAFGLDALPPSAPSLSSPIHYYYSGVIPVAWSPVVSPSGAGISYYEVSFYWAANGSLAVSPVNVSTNTSYTTTLNPGLFVARVTAFDSAGLSSYGESEEFSVFDLTAVPSAGIVGDAITLTLSALNLSDSPITAGVISFNGSNASGFSRVVSLPNTSLPVTFNATGWLEVGGSWFYDWVTVYSFPINVTTSSTTCPAGYFAGINFSFWDEGNTSIGLLGNLDAEFVVWDAARTFNVSRFANATGVGYVLVCLAQPYMTLRVDSTQVYWATDFYQRSYFLRNATVTNVSTLNISLYSANTTQGKLVLGSLLDANGQGAADRYISFNHYYPASGATLTVAMAKTDDQGNFVTYLMPNDYWYSISVTDGFSVEKIFNPLQVGCPGTASYCALSLSLIGEASRAKPLSYWGDLAYSCAVSNTTGILSCVWADASTELQAAYLEVYLVNSTSKTLFCNTTSASSAGALTCNLSANGTYSWVFYADFCCSELVSQVLDGGLYTQGWVAAVVGISGAVMTALLVVGGSLMVVFDIALVPIMAWFMLVLAVIVGFFTLGENTGSILLTLGVVAAVIAWKVRGK